ncbi:MAG TPA: threonine/serine exporter family protein [Anaerolineae bacterium]|nr:threonine/serine exporter family protein [Anaerolineae bacterium]
MIGSMAWATFLQNLMWAGVAALGYGILFNVPLRTLAACALNGAAAYAVRTIFMQSGLAGIEAATFAGATVVGFLSIIFGRIWHAPGPVLIVPGIIPLIPGALAFRTMIDILMLATTNLPPAEALFMITAVNSLKTFLIVMAIAGGIALPSLLLRRHRPMM